MDNNNYNIKNFDTIFDYNTKIGDFDGPLDLLLALVKQAQIEIKEIFVSQVTEQFIAYINEHEELDIEKTNDYLAVAATLIYEKSKAVLPPKEEEFIDMPEEDEGAVLIRRLEELNLFKEMSKKLKELENVDRYYKPPEPSAKEVKVIYKDFNMEGLIKAFTDLLTRTEIDKRIKQEKSIPKDVYTVKDKIVFIQEVMLERKECSFFELFKDEDNKPEIVTTFQAMLELLKRQFICVEQKAVFDDINIILCNDRSIDIGEIDFSEYN